MTDELTRYHKASYGAWAGRPDGTPPDPSGCAKEVRESGRWPKFSQCGRKRGYGPEGAFCKQHDPEAMAKRKAASKAKGEAAWAKRMQEYHGPSAVALLRAVARGHNDPRGAAMEWLGARNISLEETSAVSANSGETRAETDESAENLR